MMRVTLGLPVYETYKPAMVHALLHALPHLRAEILFSMPRGTYIDAAREVVMAEAIAARADRVVFVDSDMAFGPSALALLLAHDHPIVGAAYNEKQETPDGIPITTVKFSDGNGGYRAQVGEMPTAPFSCAAVGTGFMALDLPTIVRSMSPPWFEYDRTSGVRQTEDTFFCAKARAAGLAIVCDPTIQLRHMGDYGF